jgi:hypothetical protein
MESAYKSRALGNESAPQALADMIRMRRLEQLEADNIAWIEQNPDDPKMPLYDKKKKAIALGVTLGTVFNEMFPLPDDWEIVAVEHAMKMDLKKTPVEANVPLIGKLDAVIKNHKGEYWLVDHKTTSYSPHIRAKGLTFDTQALIYRTLWEKSFVGKKPLAGVIHNIIQKPTIRQKKNQRWDEYIDECFEWYDKQTLRDPQHPPVMQSWVRFDWKDFRFDKEEELVQKLKDVAYWYGGRLDLQKYWPAGNPHVYHQWGRVSPYLKLLQSHPRQWYDYLASHGFAKIHPDERYETEENDA